MKTYLSVTLNNIGIKKFNQHFLDLFKDAIKFYRVRPWGIYLTINKLVEVNDILSDPIYLES